ncbi:DUF2567 domain-containing protein [Gordonia sp. NPDC003585]|uniref:DUF2567 domain-containing protein n=1 Tax=Gordonia sp. NPDC003585 TaxID=3154275 RepID=UPI0033A29FE3
MRRPLGVLLAVVGVVVLLGAVAGATWAAITPTVTATRVDGGFTLPAEQTAKAFSGVAVFGLTMAVYGLIAALVAWFVARTWRGLLGYGAVLAATIGGSALAIEVGMWITDWLYGDRTGIALGDTVELVPRLWLRGGTAHGAAEPWTLLICAPFALTLVYLVCVLSSRTADLGVGDLDDRRHEYIAADATNDRVAYAQPTGPQDAIGPSGNPGDPTRGPR